MVSQSRRAESRRGSTQFGRLLYAGKGVAKDQAEAVKWFRKAAEQNYAQAQYNLGVCYTHGEGVAKDPVEAVKWYRKAAEQNLAKAQYNLGFCLLQQWPRRGAGSGGGLQVAVAGSEARQ